MTEHTTDTGNGRRAAHERLATGGLARWTRFCASHPWRVVLGWLAIVVVLIGLVATIGGSLRDEFEIPGSDTQRATDLIESEFADEQGGVLNIVFAAPEGQRLDTAERKAAIEEAMAELRTSEFQPTEERAGLTSVGDPFSEQTFSENGRIAYAEAQFDRVIYDEDRDVGRRGPGRRPRRGRAGRRDGRVQRRRRVPADRAGNLRAARAARGDHRAADRLPHVRRGVHPDRAGDRRARDGVPPALHPRGADRHQHDHADPRLDDRARGRDRLLALHRDAVPAASPRGPHPGGRGRRGRRLRRPRRALRGPHRRDRRQRARVLRARLRDEARDRQRARRADDRAPRELAPDLDAAAARATRSTGSSCRSCPPSTTRRRPGSGRSSPAGAAS